jgi:hypothetical protein
MTNKVLLQEFSLLTKPFEIERRLWQTRSVRRLVIVLIFAANLCLKELDHQHHHACLQVGAPWTASSVVRLSISDEGAGNRPKDGRAPPFDPVQRGAWNPTSNITLEDRPINGAWVQPAEDADG